MEQERTFLITVGCRDLVKKMVVKSSDDAVNQFRGLIQELLDNGAEVQDSVQMHAQHPSTMIPSFAGCPLVTPSEESSSSSSQGQNSSSREALPHSPPALQEMTVLPNQTESTNDVPDCNYKPLAGLEEVSVLKEDEHAESQLPPAISEISGQQQCDKPPYTGVPLRDGHRNSSRHRCCAHNRRSCPDSWLMEQIPKNTVLASQLPLVLNANVSKSSYCLGTRCMDDETDGEGRVPSHGQNVNPHSPEPCLSQEETGVSHHSVKSSANKVESKSVEYENPPPTQCLQEVSALQEQGSDEQQRNQVVAINALQQQVIQPQPVSVSGYSHEERFRDAEEEMHVLLSEEEEGAHCQQSSGTNTSAAKDDQEPAECEKPSTNECHREVSATHKLKEKESSLEMVNVQLLAQPQPTCSSGSGHTPLQGTQPDERNPVIAEPQILPHSLSSGCLVVPDMNVVPKETSKKGSQQWMYVFNGTSKRYPQEVKEEGFPSKEELKSRNDGVVIYSNKKFLRATHLPCGANCRDIFPSPWAVHQLVKKLFHFAASMQTLWNSLPDHERPSALPRELLLGSGGNGITFEHALMDQKYAVKWMDYLPNVFDAWSSFHHPNIIPLLAVVKVTPGCYVIMPRMTGNLGSAVRLICDLYSLARLEDEETWREIIVPNIQHILASVIYGVAYLHKEGYQHCDLKETNILYLKKCQCVDIFRCKCPPEEKYDVMIADFDSLKLYSSSCCDREVCKAGTLYYRSPEVHHGMVAPCCDMWSIGVIITSLCHSSKEKDKIISNLKRVIPDPDKSRDKSDFPVIETAFGREMLSSLRSECIKERDRLEPLEKIAALCLDLDNKKRVTAQQLLDNDFITKKDSCNR